MSEKSLSFSDIFSNKFRDFKEMTGLGIKPECREAQGILNQMDRAMEKNKKDGGSKVEVLVYVPQGYDSQTRAIKLSYDTAIEREGNMLNIHKVALSEAISRGDRENLEEVTGNLKNYALQQQIEFTKKQGEEK